MLKKILLTICCCVLWCCTSVQAAFPPACYPAKDHPRLWLTAERLAVFQQARQQNTERWQDFKNLCDSLIDSDPSNNPWNLDHAPQHYTAPLALMYRLSKNAHYAVRAMELMDLTLVDFSSYGNPDHENFYFLGLAYDWLYDYSGMTETKKSAYRDKMVAISTKFWNEMNLSASGTDSDQNLLTGMMHLTMGAAMYGETADAVTLLDRGWKGWEEGYFFSSGISNRDLIKSALGGVYFTGMAYFPSTDVTGISGYWLTLKTACNYDINVMEPELKPFWIHILRSLIQLTEPAREHIYPYGAWQDSNSLADQPWLRRAVAIATYFADQAGYSQDAALGRGYAAEVDIGYHNGPLLEFFFSNPAGAAISPYNANLPLVHFADEPDFLLFRDNWSKSANWGLFIGDGSIPFDHQSPDHGNFALWRGNDYLTRGARTYDAMSHEDFFNTLSIENNCTVNGEPCTGTALFNSEKRASLSRHREHDAAPLFAYSMLEADGQWNDNPLEYQPKANVITYRRHFFWAGEYVVIFDRLRTKEPGWSTYRLRSLTEPTINGTTVSQLSSNGQHKLLQCTLEPAGVTINKINETTAWSDVDDWIINSSERKWQSVINLPSATRVNILNVIQTGPASMTSFDTLEHLSSADNCGTRIANRVICFSPEENLRTEVNYAVQNSIAGMWHLVADLQAGQYDVMVDGEKITRVTVKDGDNTALFQTAGTHSSLSIHMQPYQSGNDIPPLVDIKINGSNREFHPEVNEAFVLTLSLDAADRTEPADWWLIHVTPQGAIESLDLNTMTFLPGATPIYQGQLVSFQSIQLPAFSYADTGIHWFYFAVDLEKNGTIDVESLVYSNIKVNIDTGEVDTCPSGSDKSIPIYNQAY